MLSRFQHRVAGVEEVTAKGTESGILGAGGGKMPVLKESVSEMGKTVCLDL